MICPFCSLLCDSSSTIVDCSLRIRHLEQIRTRTEDLDSIHDLIDQAKQWIEHAESIMITGRLISAESSRAALAFAKLVDGVIDCSDRQVTMDVASAMSKTGACSISIAEVRDLSDVIIVLGDDGLMDQYPKLASCLKKTDREPLLVLLGEHTPKSFDEWKKFFANTWGIECAVDRIPEALHSLFSLQIDLPASPRSHRTDSYSLFQQLRQANYISLVWAPNSIGAYAVESTGRAAWIERLLEHQVEWNESRRIGSLALSGQDSVFQQVCLWTTGYPGRVSFLNDSIDFDPSRNSVCRWIAENKNTSNALLVELDETANQANEWIDSQMKDFRGKRIVASCSRRSETKEDFSSIHLPTQIAGFDRPADLLRADQTVLARVPEAKTMCSDSTRSVWQWMEALSQ
ncbi:MAG: hypothetical protein MUC83_10600 [Pirellula sp.]|jgi:formylmethanofuran dehydrogenase subunit B|nr:hypothetical protein [Pirellula sp.]